jgi:hypothetical protein
MDYSKIATHLRELADLFDSAPAQVKTEAPKAEAKKPEPEVKKPTPEPEAKAETQAEPTTTIDNVRDALAKLIDAGKRDVALQVLKDHGAAKVGELKAENFASVVKAIEKALA